MKLAIAILLVNVLWWSSGNWVGTANSAIALQTKATTLKGNVSQNEMIDQLETYGIKCLIKQGLQNSLVVQNVRQGSGAYYKGVAAGDVVLSAIQKNDTFTLTVQRNGQVYQILFKALLPQEGQNTALKGKVKQNDSAPVLSVTPPHIPVLKEGEKPPEVGEGNTQKEKKLVSYDIELIIDISGSMNEQDGTGGYSKFEWCHQQVKDLAARMAPYEKTFTITTL